jgi:hypothetical protein
LLAPPLVGALTFQGVLDAATQPSTFPTSPFLARAAATIARRSTTHDLREEEELLQEWERILPRYWQYDTETTNSRDPVRITQAERLHCVSRRGRGRGRSSLALTRSCNTSSR